MGVGRARLAFETRNLQVVCYEVAMVPAVRVVILNYNGGDDVLESVEHALALEWPADRLDIVVVDNASTDGSAMRVDRRFDDVRVLYNAVNTGFPANNLAMRDLDDLAYVALVNPDAFVEPGWLAPLVEELEADDGLGAACPRMLLHPRFADLSIVTDGHRVPRDGRDLGIRISGLRVDGEERIAELLTVQGVSGPESNLSDSHYHWTSAHATVGVPLDPDATTAPLVEIRVDSSVAKTAVVGSTSIEIDEIPRWHRVQLDGSAYDVINNAGSILVEGGWGADRGLGERDGVGFDDPTEVFAWCGGGVLLRTEYLRDVGLFDEDFFLYYEDTDLSWRGQGLGWRYRYVPSARMRHLHGASTVVGSPLFVLNVERNRLLMLLKNAPVGFVLRAHLGFLRSTLGIARLQVVGPLTRGARPDFHTVWLRLRAFAAAARAAPRTIRKRVEIRRRMRVDDESILRWQVPQP